MLNPDLASSAPIVIETDPPPVQAATTRDDNVALEGLQRPFADMPVWIWRSFFASWLTLLAAFIVIFGVSGEVRFVLGVVCVFAAAFFGTPLILLRMTRRRNLVNTHSRVSILTGSCSATEAALQIVLLPMVLCVGLIAIGFSIPR